MDNDCIAQSFNKDKTSLLATMLRVPVQYVMEVCECDKKEAQDLVSSLLEDEEG